MFAEGDSHLDSKELLKCLLKDGHSRRLPSALRNIRDLELFPKIKFFAYLILYPAKVLLIYDTFCGGDQVHALKQQSTFRQRPKDDLDTQISQKPSLEYFLQLKRSEGGDIWSKQTISLSDVLGHILKHKDPSQFLELCH